MGDLTATARRLEHDLPPADERLDRYLTVSRVMLTRILQLTPDQAAVVLQATRTALTQVHAKEPLP